MKGFRFYLEYETPAKKRTGTVKEPGEHDGNVVALSLESEKWIREDNVMQEAYTAVYEHADSPVCYSSVSLGYLHEKCRRIPEALARQIHPNLFSRIDADAERDKTT